MKSIKIVIEIKNHTVQFVFANVDIRYVIVNYDDQDKGLYPLSVPLEPEAVQEPLHLCYTNEDASQAEIREQLKRIDF